MSSFDKTSLAVLYRRRAGHYDVTANLYYLIGFREQAYRRKAVESLDLQRGDTVVEIGSGTGLNFSLLHDRVGPEGRIIGVDLTDAMLEQAEKRVKRKGWLNVELTQGDAANFKFPEKADGILSTFAITLMPEFDKVIQAGCMSLSPGKKWVVLDFKMPSNRFSLFAPLLVFLTKPFGVSMELSVRHPWESFQKYLKKFFMQEFYMGFVYIASGEKGKCA